MTNSADHFDDDGDGSNAEIDGDSIVDGAFGIIIRFGASLLLDRESKQERREYRRGQSAGRSK